MLHRLLEWDFYASVLKENPPAPENKSINFKKYIISIVIKPKRKILEVAAKTAARPYSERKEYSDFLSFAFSIMLTAQS